MWKVYVKLTALSSLLLLLMITSINEEIKQEKKVFSIAQKNNIPKVKIVHIPSLGNIDRTKKFDFDYDLFDVRIGEKYVSKYKKLIPKNIKVLFGNKIYYQDILNYYLRHPELFAFCKKLSTEIAKIYGYGKIYTDLFRILLIYYYIPNNKIYRLLLEKLRNYVKEPYYSNLKKISSQVYKIIKLYDININPFLVLLTFVVETNANCKNIKGNGAYGFSQIREIRMKRLAEIFKNLNLNFDFLHFKKDVDKATKGNEKYINKILLYDILSLRLFLAEAFAKVYKDLKKENRKKFYQIPRSYIFLSKTGRNHIYNLWVFVSPIEKILLLPFIKHSGGSWFSPIFGKFNIYGDPSSYKNIIYSPQELKNYQYIYNKYYLYYKDLYNNYLRKKYGYAKVIPIINKKRFLLNFPAYSIYVILRLLFEV